MIGDTVSHYRVTTKLGEGGMGAVYAAEDLQLHRTVALKFLTSDLAADPDARQRLVKEARAASRLNHPNIATIYEVEETGETPFIAMEQVIGENLRQVLLRGAMSAPQAVNIARQIAEGLREAHDSGVLHRDIKPGNIMLDSSQRVKILDFGLAAQQERETDESDEQFMTKTTTASTTAGTVPYMSPEQITGEPLDSRSDIFSFGALLYECLTGRIPFQGETAIDMLHAILRQDPPSLRTLVPNVPSEWEQIIERCMAKSPEQRYASMSDVLTALNRAAAPPKKAEKSLAVLYFENLSRSEEDEYFRDGITEDIIIELSKISGLKVFPRSAVLSFRDQPSTTAPQVAQQLGATHVLTGSLRRAGDRLRFTAQLIESRTGHSMWAERYDRQLEDVFAIQDELAQNIAGALQVMLSDEEKKAIKKAPTADVQAYDYYLRGRQFMHQFRRKGLEFARQMFARAIVMDPNYARAYAGVADCCSFLYQWFEASETNLKEADSASQKALQLDPESAEAHASRGLAVSLNKRYDEAEKEFQIAIRLNPRLFEAHYFFARTRLAEGKLPEAASLFEEACRVNPEDYQAPNLLAMVYDGLGRKSDARAAYRRSLEIINKHLELNPGDVRALSLGASALFEMGEREKSLEWARQARITDPEDSGVLYNIACLYALQGETEEALDCIEQAIQTGFGQKEWIENDPDLDQLRELPRFKALVAQL